MAILYDYKNTFDFIRYNRRIFTDTFTNITTDMGISTRFRGKNMFSLSINDGLYDETDNNVYCMRITNQVIPFISSLSLVKNSTLEKRIVVHYDNCVLLVSYLSQLTTNSQYTKVNDNCVMEIDESVSWW